MTSPVLDLVVEKWKRQHQGQPNWVQHYWDSRSLPSRGLVIEGLRSLEPWGSLAELGCNSGPMLAEIQSAFPETHVAGIEPNLVAARAAQSYLGERVPIFYGSLQEWLADEPLVDVLVTHYTLAYIAPSQLRPILADMCHSAKRGLVLAEPMGPEALIWEFPEWRHDYVTVLQSLGLTDFTTAPVEGVGNLNAILVARCS